LLSASDCASEGGGEEGGGGGGEEGGVFSTHTFARTCLHFVLLEEKVFRHRGHSNDFLDFTSFGFQPQTFFATCLHFEAFDEKVFAQCAQATADAVAGLLLHISPRTCRSILNLLANSLKQ
jgi:hypothetical protein